MPSTSREDPESSRVAANQEGRFVRSAQSDRRHPVVIDDEPDNVEPTVMVLVAERHSAHGSTEVSAGLHLAIDHRADVVVLDYMMPTMNGAELAAALRDIRSPAEPES